MGSQFSAGLQFSQVVQLSFPNSQSLPQERDSFGTFLVEQEISLKILLG
jgi:hypothetical protein